MAGVSRAYSRPAHHHQEEPEDSTSAADDTSLEDLMAQMKSIWVDTGHHSQVLKLQPPGHPVSETVNYHKLKIALLAKFPHKPQYIYVKVLLWKILWCLLFYVGSGY